jgi:hypothetical protein
VHLGHAELGADLGLGHHAAVEPHHQGPLLAAGQFGPARGRALLCTENLVRGFDQQGRSPVLRP